MVGPERAVAEAQRRGQATQRTVSAAQSLAVDGLVRALLYLQAGRIVNLDPIGTGLEAAAEIARAMPIGPLPPSASIGLLGAGLSLDRMLQADELANLTGRISQGLPPGADSATVQLDLTGAGAGRPIELPAPNQPVAIAWIAGIAPMPNVGGSVLALIGEGTTPRELRLHLDANGAAYVGSVTSAAGASSLAFDIGPGLAGWALRLHDGTQVRQFRLGAEPPGFAWTRTPTLPDQTSTRLDLRQFQGLSVADVLGNATAAAGLLGRPRPPRTRRQAPDAPTPASTVAEATHPCRQCGHPNPTAHRFCDSCGASLASASPTASPSENAFPPTPTSQSECRACGGQLRAGAVFCTRCGTRTPDPAHAASSSPTPPQPAVRAAAPPSACTACGAPLRPGARYCTKCGTTVPTPTAARSATPQAGDPGGAPPSPASASQRGPAATPGSHSTGRTPPAPPPRGEVRVFSRAGSNASRSATSGPQGGASSPPPSASGGFGGSPGASAPGSPESGQVADIRASLSRIADQIVAGLGGGGASSNTPFGQLLARSIRASLLHQHVLREVAADPRLQREGWRAFGLALALLVASWLVVALLGGYLSFALNVQTMISLLVSQCVLWLVRVGAMHIGITAWLKQPRLFGQTFGVSAYALVPLGFAPFFGQLVELWVLATTAAAIHDLTGTTIGKAIVIALGGTVAAYFASRLIQQFAFGFLAPGF